MPLVLAPFRLPPSSHVLRTAAVLVLVFSGGHAHAEASGPDYWDVTGVARGDVLNLHRGSSARSAVILRIPHDATALRNLGCTNVPSFAAWQRMSEAERERAKRRRWCRVEFRGRNGWVAGRYLKEGGGPATSTGATAIGRWTVACSPQPCIITQTTRDPARSATLRIRPDGQGNAEISIEKTALPRHGVMSITIDGQLFSSGPIAPLLSADGKRIVFPPDDITAGLLKRMKTQASMAITIPGEDRANVFKLGRFEDAWILAAPTPR